MQYKEYKGIRLSRLGMGVMRLPVEDQDDSRIDHRATKSDDRPVHGERH